MLRFGSWGWKRGEFGPLALQPFVLSSASGREPPKAGCCLAAAWEGAGFHQETPLPGGGASSSHPPTILRPALVLLTVVIITSITRIAW